MLSSSSIVNDTSQLEGKVQVLFSGKRLNNLEAISVRIANSGNVPIKKNEFEKEIQLSFGKDARVIMARVPYTYPKKISVKTSFKGDMVTVTPLLLNPGDQFIIESFVTGSISTIELDTRIEGITQTTPLAYSHHGFIKRKNILILIGGCLSYLVYMYTALLLSDTFRKTASQFKLTFLIRSEIVFIFLSALVSSVILFGQYFKDMAYFTSLKIYLIVFLISSIFVVLPFRILLRSIKNKLTGQLDIYDVNKNNK